MSEFKIGDLVLVKCDPPYASYAAVVKSALADDQYSIEAVDNRSGTTAPSHALTLIKRDWQVVTKPTQNTPEPLVDMGEGVVVKDAVMFANQQKTNTLSERVDENDITRTCLDWLTAKFPHFIDSWKKQEAGTTFAAQLVQSAWQARQAEVDEKQKRIDSVESILRALFEKSDQKYAEAAALNDGEKMDYWTGQCHGLDMALHSLGFKDSFDKALGGEV